MARIAFFTSLCFNKLGSLLLSPTLSRYDDIRRSSGCLTTRNFVLVRSASRRLLSDLGTGYSLKASFSLAPYSFSHRFDSGKSLLKSGSSLNKFVVHVED